MGPRHVEFVGIPGSGKTTLVSKLASTPGLEGYQLRIGYKVAVTRTLFPAFLNNVGRYLPVEAVELLSVLSSVTHPSRHRGQNDAFIQTAHRLIGAYTDDPARRDVVKEWIFDSTIQFSTANTILSPSVHLLCDEGFLQRAVATFCPPSPTKALTRDDIASYLSAMPEPDLVILLDVSDEIAINRMHARPSGPPDWIDTDVTDRLKQIRNFMTELEPVLHEQNIKHEMVDNDVDMTESHMMLTELLQEKE